MRFAGFIIGVMLTSTGFWLGGFDFNERGNVAVLMYLTCLLSGVMGAAFLSNFEG